MMQGRLPPKIKQQTESRRESTGSLLENGKGRSGHVRNKSRSIIDGDFSNTSLQPESPVARKDQLQSTDKKSHGPGLPRSNSIRHEDTGNTDSRKIKKPAEHNYMKTTQYFNAKSKRPVDLESTKVKKKVDPDPYGTRHRSEDMRGLQRSKPAEPMNAYLKARSRPSSVSSQNTPMLTRSPSVYSPRVPRQIRQGTEMPAGKKKSGTREETEVGSFTSHHLSYGENGESDVKQIIEDMSSYLPSNKPDSMLEIDEAEIKPGIVSQTSNKDEMKLLGDSELPSGHNSSEKMEDIRKTFPEVEIIETIMEVSPEYPDSNVEVIIEIPSGHNSSEKMEDISKILPEVETIETIMEASPEYPNNNVEVITEIPSAHNSSEKMEDISTILPEAETTETIMEVSPEYPDGNVEVITEKNILEEYEVTEESVPEIKKEVMESFPPEKVTRERDENDEKHEVIDTKYEEIDDLCVLSSSNDEADDLCEISIEDELSKIIGIENTHCTEQEKKALSSDIMSIIEEIANELAGMEKIPARGNGGAWLPKTWKVDYVLQRLIQKLESTDKNQVSMLIQAYESVIQLMMRRMTLPLQASSQ